MFLLCVAYMNQPCFCVPAGLGAHLSLGANLPLLIQPQRSPLVLLILGTSPFAEFNIFYLHACTALGVRISDATNQRAYTHSSELLRRVTERSSTREDTDFFSKLTGAVVRVNRRDDGMIPCPCGLEEHARYSFQKLNTLNKQNPHPGIDASEWADLPSNKQAEIPPASPIPSLIPTLHDQRTAEELPPPATPIPHSQPSNRTIATQVSSGSYSFGGMSKALYRNTLYMSSPPLLPTVASTLRSMLLLIAIHNTDLNAVHNKLYAVLHSELSTVYNELVIVLDSELVIVLHSELNTVCNELVIISHSELNIVRHNSELDVVIDSGLVVIIVDSELDVVRH
ncbi:hypothetical protein GG344DRAFT_71293, partial [Lentinula edodes]